MSLNFNEIKGCAKNLLSKAAGVVSPYIEKLRKPFVKYDFSIVESVHVDEDSEPIEQNVEEGSFKIHLFDIVVALTFLLAIFSIFSKNDD